MRTSGEVAALNPDDPTKSSPAAFAQARATRPEICGSDAPERPYPIYLRGVVERGFGRGGKDLGCPTANLPSKILNAQTHLNRTGIYYGYARVLAQDPDDPDLMKASDGDPTQTEAGSSNGSRPREVEGQDYDYDDPGDEEWEVDEDEIILSASPTGSVPGEGRFSPAYALSADTPKLKPRQLSKSSARSFRGIAAAMEKGSSTASDRSAASKGANRPVEVGMESATTPEVKPTASVVSGAPTHSKEPSEKHDRDISNSSSATSSSLRRRRKVHVPISPSDQKIFPMVMSIGWNPFYKNTSKTAEVHIMHRFEADFYGLEMRVVVLGYIRPEFNYVSKEALVEDIEIDKRVAHNSLARALYQDYASDPFLLAPS